MKLELLLGDTQTTPDVARREAERVVGQGARVLMGSFDSGSTAAMVSVAQQKRVPFLVDIAAADSITANVAKSVTDGQAKVQYVYRNFPTGSSFGRLAVRYFKEVFNAAGVSPKRVVLMHANDLFGQSQSKGFIDAHTAARPAWEIVAVIPWPEPPADLSAQVARAKAAKPDVIAPITRLASAQRLLPEIRKQRVELMGIVGPGSPGLYEAGQVAVLKGDLEYVMDNVPSWPNFKRARTQQAAEEYRRRSGGKAFDTNSVASYDGILIIADVLERVGKAALSEADGPEAIVDAMKTTSLRDILAVAAGPVVFNEIGDNPNASTAMIQILGQKPVVVWAKDAAVQKFVFPRPSAARG